MFYWHYTVWSRPHPMAVKPLAGSRAVVYDVRPHIIDGQLGRLSSVEECRAMATEGVWEDATDCYSMLQLQDYLIISTIEYIFIRILIYIYQKLSYRYRLSFVHFTKVRSKWPGQNSRQWQELQASSVKRAILAAGAAAAFAFSNRRTGFSTWKCCRLRLITLWRLSRNRYQQIT